MGFLRGRLGLAVVAAILVGLGATAAVYANGLTTGKDVNTESHFHLTSYPLQLCRTSTEPRVTELKPTCAGVPTARQIFGNLFTFTHPDTPSEAKISEWSFEKTATWTKKGKISGSFVIKVDLPGQSFGDADGDILVSFNAQASFVPQVATDEPWHFNFEGPFRITGGSGFYEGIIGEGTIGGTFHAHKWGEGELDGEVQRPWFDFVMIGKARFP